MLEQDALKLWCPFARDSDHEYGGFNRWGGNAIHKRDSNGRLLYSLPNGTLTTEGIRPGAPGQLLSNQAVVEYQPIEPARACLCIGRKCMAWQPTSSQQDPGSSGDCRLMQRGAV